MRKDGTCPSHPAAPDEPGFGRRRLLQAGAVLGAASTVSLAPLSFASAAEGSSGDVTKMVTGHLESGAPDFVYLPVEVPAGVREIAVSYSYNKPSVPAGTLGNVLNIGAFDERGTALGGKGFRGWSGGARTSFAISRTEATPGYLPGPVNPGTWYVVLGLSQVAPQGMDYRVEVTLMFGAPGPDFRPTYPPERARGRGRAWYRGDCHLHTVHSDGKRLPAEVAAGAKAARLDFVISTDHNTSSAHGIWGQYADQDLLILTGEEVTTRNGHWLALGVDSGTWIDWRYRTRDDAFSRFARQVRRSGGLVVPAHPYCPYVACQWKFGYEDADAMEVWTGPWTYDDESAVDTWDAMLGEALRRGRRWTPAMGNSDAHSVPQVIGMPHNVVLADDLSRSAVLDGLRAGRTWIAESADVQLKFTVTGGGKQAGPGESLKLPTDAPVDAQLEVSGVPGGTVRFITDEGQMHQESLPASGSGTVVWRATASLAAYIRAEVRHPMADGTPGKGNTMAADLQWGPMAALTNPVILHLKG
ncbi:CehA/McbA family metallohydrolase [Streptomyces sp. NPDC056708]|uniref:CehA/McbA family metallohydrolase n=1 Tax=unclassified Streptomyces TaxID=2593676 RepID=UPI00368BB871